MSEEKKLLPQVNPALAQSQPLVRSPVLPVPDLADRVSQIGPHTLKKVGWMLKAFLDDADVDQMRLAKSAATTAAPVEGEDPRVRIVKILGPDGQWVCGPASTADIELLDAWEAELAALDAL